MEMNNNESKQDPTAPLAEPLLATSAAGYPARAAENVSSFQCSAAVVGHHLGEGPGCGDGSGRAGRPYELRQSVQRHLSSSLLSDLLEETEVLVPPRKRSSPASSGDSPPHKSAASVVQAPGIPSATAPRRHFCPFKGCVEDEVRGAGWSDPRRMYVHVNHIHIEANTAPDDSFLRHHNKEVCLTCKALKPRDKVCPGCLNRQRKTVIRCPRGTGLAPPPGPASASANSLGAPNDEEITPALPTSPVLDEYDVGLPTPMVVGQTRISTMHVPKPLRSVWKALLRHELEAFLRTRTRVSFQRFYLAPKCIPSRGAGRST